MRGALRRRFPVLFRVGMLASIWGLGAGLSGPAGAASEMAEALRLALETHPTLVELQANLDALEEDREQARAGLRPRFVLSGRADGSFSDDGLGSERGRDSAGSASALAEARQLVFDGGATRETVAQFEAELRALRHDLVGAEQDVLLAAAEAYLNLLRAGELLDVAESNAARLGEALAAARDRLRVGSGTRTSVAQAEARLGAAETNIARRRAAYATARSEFTRQVGTEPAAELVAPTDLPDLPASLDTAIEASLKAHPDIAAAQAREDAARAALRAAEAGRGPTISLLGSASVSRDEARGRSSKDRDDYGIGLRLEQSLYSGGAVDSRIRQAVARMAARQAARTRVERRLRAAAVAAWEERVAAQAAIRSGVTQVRAAELAYRGVRESASVGLGTTLDVLDAEQDALSARVSLVQARYDEFIAAFRLRQAVGTLSAQGLRL